jgi:hypothetical protein
MRHTLIITTSALAALALSASIVLADNSAVAKGHGQAVAAVAQAVDFVSGKARGEAVSALAKTHGAAVSAAAKLQGAAASAAGKAKGAAAAAAGKAKGAAASEPGRLKAAAAGGS